MTYRSPRYRNLVILIAVELLGAACQPRPVPLAASRLDDTPRIAVISAFAPEMTQLLAKTTVEGRYEASGLVFTTGRLAGKPVVLFLSGVSMVNAAMSTQAALDHFHITAIVFSGIAGGVNPDLNIGDVVVPAQWAEYQEQVFARAKGSGWDTGYHARSLGNYGMMFPQPVTVPVPGRAGATEDKVWFAADSTMLAAAGKAAAQVTLRRCAVAGSLCLEHAPRVVTNGRGVSGSTFVDNADYRAWVWQNFQADALDMESAAVAHVAYTNGVPFIVFRALSDLAGGGPGANELPIFLALAADNSSSVVAAFLADYP